MAKMAADTRQGCSGVTRHTNRRLPVHTRPYVEHINNMQYVIFFLLLLLSSLL